MAGGQVRQLDLLTKHQTAKLLTVSVRLLSDPQWRERAGLIAYRIGPRLLRFERGELHAWIERHREGVPAGPA
jgi:hypothetical protein